MSIIDKYHSTSNLPIKDTSLQQALFPILTLSQFTFKTMSTKDTTVIDIAPPTATSSAVQFPGIAEGSNTTTRKRSNSDPGKAPLEAAVKEVIELQTLTSGAVAEAKKNGVTDETLQTWIKSQKKDNTFPWYGKNLDTFPAVITMCAIAHILAVLVASAAELKEDKKVHYKFAPNTVTVTPNAGDQTRPEAKLLEVVAGSGTDAELSESWVSDMKCLVAMADKLLLGEYGSQAPDELKEYISGVNDALAHKTDDFVKALESVKQISRTKYTLNLVSSGAVNTYYKLPSLASITVTAALSVIMKALWDMVIKSMMPPK